MDLTCKLSVLCCQTSNVLCTVLNCFRACLYCTVLSACKDCVAQTLTLPHYIDGSQLRIDNSNSFIKDFITVAAKEIT